jgi:hypothetical protein
MIDADAAVTVCGRSFSEADIKWIRAVIAQDPPLCRSEIARATCEALGWRTADGRIKAMSCRVALLRLERLGSIVLPPPRWGNGNGQPYRSAITIVEPNTPIAPVIDLRRDVQVRPVQDRRDSRLWNEAIHRFHYLGYRPLPGAQVRYLVESDKSLLGAIGFSAAAWKVKPRDAWIGWSPSQRTLRLDRVVNNGRFLILPWVRIPHLASRVLSLCARRIASDMEERYGTRPVLLETFVERERFRGTCYQAANWIYVGDTQGRGKLDRQHRHELPVKHVYLYPLCREARAVLCSGAA